MASNFEFYSPTRVIFGKGTEQRVGALVREYGGTRVLIVYGGKSAVRSGVLDRAENSLAEAGISSWTLGGVVPNPHLDKVYEGIRIGKENSIDFLLAVGGGSVIDTAKAISLGAKNSVPLWELYSGKAQTQRALPIGVVLTTAATASEANGVSVLCHDVLHEKAALDEPLTRPRFALMNPVLTYTLPPRQTASCAVDIFSHAFERYFHKVQQGTLRSQMCAAVMRTVITELPRALAHPDSYDARSQLMWASTVAHSNMLGFEGDFACHALSHVFTTELGLPHGAALGILMTAWCKYMLTDETEAIADFCTLVWQVPSCPSQIQTAQNGISAFQDFLCSSGLPVTLREAGLCDVSIEHLARLALPDMAGTLGGNFRALDYGAVVSLLQLARG